MTIGRRRPLWLQHADASLARSAYIVRRSAYDRVLPSVAAPPTRTLQSFTVAKPAPARSRGGNHLFDRRHDRPGRRLMDHVPRAVNASKRALADVLMQSHRLRIDVDQAVLIAGNDDNGHLQISVRPPEAECIGNHERG